MRATRKTSCCMQGSGVTQLEGPLVLVCHDAGAANLALSWIEALQLAHPLECRAVLQGPAASLAANFQLDIQTFVETASALRGASLLISGTGWASVLEHQARALAYAVGVHSIAVLDHWVNYRDRFVRNGQMVLPDEIWVADHDAHALATRQFPDVKIVLQSNLYLQKQLREIGPPPSVDEVLYLLEPARSDWGRQIPGEFQALDYFMQHSSRVGIAVGTPVRLRPHPSDAPGKYDRWLRAHAGAATLAPPTPLAADLDRATWVAGCETAALAIAIAAGRRTVCTLPPWAPPCRLPQQELIHLQKLVPATQ